MDALISSIDICIFDHVWRIFSVETAVSCDSFLISFATTVNPAPFSPALAASIAAFNTNKIV